MPRGRHGDHDLAGAPDDLQPLRAGQRDPGQVRLGGLEHRQLPAVDHHADGTGPQEAVDELVGAEVQVRAEREDAREVVGEEVGDRQGRRVEELLPAPPVDVAG